MVLQTLFYLQTFTLSIFYSLNALMSNAIQSNSRLATYTVGVLATSYVAN